MAATALGLKKAHPTLRQKRPRSQARRGRFCLQNPSIGLRSGFKRQQQQEWGQIPIFSNCSFAKMGNSFSIRLRYFLRQSHFQPDTRVYKAHA